MKQTYRFHVSYGHVIKELNGDRQAFKYADSMTKDVIDIPVDKKINGVWCAWDFDEQKWVQIPITEKTVMVNGIPTVIKSNQKVVQNLLSKQDVVIDEDCPACCDPSTETYHCM